MKTQERQERLARVQETARRKGYAVATPPRGKYRYTLRANRRGGATYMSRATLEAVERWLGTDEPPTPALSKNNRGGNEQLLLVVEGSFL